MRLTETHRPDDGDANGCVLSDADLGILAAPAERYASYVAAVRTEYAHLDDATFDGRAPGGARGPAGQAAAVPHGVRAASTGRTPPAPTWPPSSA